MLKQVAVWKVVVLAAALLAAYLVGFSAAGSSDSEALASPLGIPDQGAQMVLMNRNLENLQATVRVMGGQMQEINELLKSGRLQVVVAGGNGNGGNSDADGGAGENDVQRVPATSATGQVNRLHSLVERQGR